MKAFAAVIVGFLVAAVSVHYTAQVKEEANRTKAECDVLTEEAKGLMAKNEMLKVLRSKPMTVGQAMEIIDVIGNQKGIPISIVLAMVEQESEFHPRAVSHMGARGLTQVMPATLRYYIKDPALLKQIERPVVNVTGGLMHLAYLNSKFGAWDKTLRAYYAGEDQANSKEHDWYQKSILRKASKYTYLE
jgi:soluble lytic murein transglycosylase-like protein